MAATTVVISAIGGYDAATIRPFVESVLRRSRADLHLIDLPRTPRPAWLQWLAGEPRVSIHVCSQPMEPASLAVHRFALIQRLLPELNVDELLLCDSRDVLLQADPFSPAQASAPMSSYLWLAEEPKSLGDCATNLQWLQRYGTPQEVNIIQRRSVLCSGTIQGSRHALMAAIDALVKRCLSQLNGSSVAPWGLDQSTLNLLAWQDQLGVPFTARGNHDGFALTLHHSEHLCLDRAGRLLLGNGQVAPIVHQYDRIPWLADHLLRQLDGFSQHA